jgi:hypothetical protein
LTNDKLFKSTILKLKTLGLKTIPLYKDPSFPKISYSKPSAKDFNEFARKAGYQNSHELATVILGIYKNFSILRKKHTAIFNDEVKFKKAVELELSNLSKKTKNVQDDYCWRSTLYAFGYCSTSYVVEWASLEVDNQTEAEILDGLAVALWAGCIANAWNFFASCIAN